MTKASAVASMDRSIRKFNPGTFQSDKEIIQQFVVRQREFNTVLEVLRDNLDASSCQHVLVVAPRGRGKTMLLARIAAELRTNGTLSRHMWPVRLMEESQEIFTLADFWLEVLFYLAQECSVRAPELARELRDAHTAFAKRWREDNLEHYVRATVLEASDRLHKRLVLMVENLQELCRNVDNDFGWKLRQTLQTEPQIMLLATATCRFRELDDAEQSFFELFRIVYLAPLSTSECQRLWQVASADKATEREIRPLEILTGGSPRLLVIVAGFARHGSLNQLMEELVRLIDDHTEYFRGHLEILAKTERRVFLAIMDLWQPSSTGEIAARARLDVRTTSTMLGRLVERGAVVAEGGGGKRQYTAAERLYCIYYKLRRERDEAAIVSNLIHFMAVFYRETELAEIFVRLALEAAVSSTIQEGIARAIHDDPQIVSVFRDVRLPDIEPETNQDMATAMELLSEGYGQWKQGRTAEAVATLNKAIAICSDREDPKFQSLVAVAFRGKATLSQELGELETAIEAYDEVVARLGVSSVLESQVTVARALVCTGCIHHQLGNIEAAIDATATVVRLFGSNGAPELQKLMAQSLALQGACRIEGSEFELAITAFEAIVERFGSSDTPELQQQVAGALLAKCISQLELGAFETAAVTSDILIEQFGSSDTPELQKQVAGALFYKCISQLKLGAFETAAVTSDILIEQFGSSDTPELQEQVAWALLYKGLLQFHLGEFKAAVATYDNMFGRFGSSSTPELQQLAAQALVTKCTMQRRLHKFKAALKTAKEMVKHFGVSDTPRLQKLVVQILIEKGKIQTAIGHSGKALRIYDELNHRLGTVKSQLRSQVDTHSKELQWRSEWVRTQALQVHGMQGVAMDTFRTVYAEFQPGNDAMMREMQVQVPELIANGASVHDIVEILETDTNKSGKLTPLVCALHQLAGKSVRAPAEVLEVAADILAQIELNRRI